MLKDRGNTQKRYAERLLNLVIDRKKGEESAQEWSLSTQTRETSKEIHVHCTIEP